MTAPNPGTLDEIIDNFSLLDEWDDRYRYVVELGDALAPLDERDRNEANKVQGCASRVWLAKTVRPNGSAGPVLIFSGDSDARIVRILAADARAPGVARASDPAAIEWLPVHG
jgi:cysteine desulfuration protein SufE